jgi:hypothetical protein
MFYHGASGVHPDRISSYSRNKRNIDTVRYAHCTGRFAKHAFCAVARNGATDTL